MTHVEMLLLVLLVDAVLGDPPWLWGRIGHPAVWMGRLIALCEAKCNHGAGRRAKGLVVVLGLVIGVTMLGALLAWIPDYGLIEVAGGVALMAHRSLLEHMRDVVHALAQGIGHARRAVAMIVGRDVSGLDESGVARAAIESGAENFSDGVIAPAFWFLIFGLPGMLVYKLVNTADSMIGHKNARYGAFGWAAARLDDVLNWVPARLTGLLICATGRPRNAFDVMMHDADLHTSPNAGWPEAAMAGSLDIALGGPRSYGGAVAQLPWMNSFGRRDLRSADIVAAMNRLWRAWGIFGLGLLALAALGAMAGIG
ncbi:MAG: adenosylcobinamide-phosphate synthase CbiB [Paracoccaceae bacterium]